MYDFCISISMIVFSILAHLPSSLSTLPSICMHITSLLPYQLHLQDIISFNEQSNQAIERSSSNTPREDPTRPSSSLPEFTYRYAKKACVKEQDIINISTFIKEMYTKHNIRVFPRNGFLLGIIRHGGECFHEYFSIHSYAPRPSLICSMFLSPQHYRIPTNRRCRCRFRCSI